MTTLATISDFDLDWINEEETLLQMGSTPQHSLLTKIHIQFLFVDMDSEIRSGIKLIQPLQIDISQNVSILPKTTLLRHIETAKQKYISKYSCSCQFSLMDVLIWNANIEPDQISRYAELYEPEIIGTTFIHGSIFEDIILPPSLFVFHSEQTIYIILREKPLPASSTIRGILRNKSSLDTTIATSKKHATKRVQFAKNTDTKRTTRKAT